MFSKIALRRRAYYNKLTIPKMLSKTKNQTAPHQALSIWVLPKLLLATHKNSRRLMWAAAGGLTLLSTTAGPIALVTVGSIASLLSWRIFKNTTTQWLDFSMMPLPQTTIYHDTIRILKERRLGRSNSLVWGKVSKSDLTCLLDGTQQTTIFFSIYEPKGPLVFHVKVSAHIYRDGQIKILRIILRSARGYKEVIPK
jgi:hypothetical protein